MGKRNKVSRALCFIWALIVFAGLIIGCYSRDTLVEEQNIYGQDTKSDPLSEKELKKFAASVRRVDGEAEAHYQLALYFQERWRHKLAIDELKQVLLRDPVNAKAYNAMGVSFDNLGDHDAAIDYYKLALKVDSKLDYVYNNLGYSYLLKNDIQHAVESFEQAIALNEKEKRYRNNLGLAYAKQGKYDLAFAQFRSLDSEVNAEKTLARVMKDLGKGDQIDAVLVAVKHTAKNEAVASAGEAPPAASDVLPALYEERNPFDPVNRFRSLTQSISALAEEPGTEAAGGIEDSKTVVESESSEEKGPQALKEALSEVRQETLEGPFIEVTTPPMAEKDKGEIQIAEVRPWNEGVADKDGGRNDVEYYHVSSVALSQEPPMSSKPAAAPKTLEVYQLKPLTRELRAIAPPTVEIITPVDQEVHEERILVASSSTQAAGWQAAPEPGRTVAKGIVEIEVENGNGVKGAAGRVAEHLRRNGFTVVRVSDAQSFDHLNTKVFYYSGNLNEVRRLLQVIPEITKDAELYEMEKMGNSVRLLIGRDLVERNNTLSWRKPRSIDSRIGG